MTNYKTLILAGLAAIGLAACGSTVKYQAPSHRIEEVRTPCESASPNDLSYVWGFRVVGDDAQKLFYSEAVGIKTGSMKVMALADSRGTKYHAEGTVPNDKVHSDSLNDRYYRDMAIDFLKEADRLDGREDRCVMPVGIDTLMNRLYQENAKYTFVEEPTTFSIDSESYYLSNENGTGSYERTKTTENGKTTVREDLSGDLSKEEIVGENNSGICNLSLIVKDGVAEVRDDCGGKLANQEPKFNQTSSPDNFSGTCGWDYRSDLRSCDWDFGREQRNCDWDFRTDGKSQRWLNDCLSDANYHYAACAELAENRLNGCRER